jgi:hypothetical protein
MNLNKITLIVSICVISVCSCTKDKGVNSGGFSDEYLYKISKDTTDKYVYKDNTNISEFNSFVPDHGNKPYSLFMNRKAYDACTDGGKLPSGGSFPDSSLLVKYLKNATGGTLNQLVVMYKRKGTWVWAEYDPSGGVLWSYKQEAALCLTCHTATPRDYTQTFDAHP